MIALTVWILIGFIWGYFTCYNDHKHDIRAYRNMCERAVNAKLESINNTKEDSNE